MKYFILLFLFVVSFVDAKTIVFSPLPMDKAPKLYAQYKPMLEYLERETGYKFEFVFSATYSELIENFKKKKVDIVELGPLPFVKLKQQYNNAEAFITFKSKNAKPFYTCDLVTTDKDINSLKDISKKTKIILTRKLSTCGYLMSEYIFESEDKTLKNYNYTYVGTHSKVLLNLLIENDAIGTAKSTVIEKYNRNFHFKTLKKSPLIPGFAFVANKATMDQKEVKNIQNAILKLDPFHNSKDQKMMSKWSSNVKYGGIKTKDDAYNVVTNALKKIKIPKGGKK